MKEEDMRRITGFRPTPAMVVATIALLVALGGTGVAAVSKLAPPNTVGTAAVIDGSLLAKDLKAGAIPSGGALAYAHVTADGTIDAAFSKNVVSVPAKQNANNARFYCLDVTTKQTPRNVVATLEYVNSSTKWARVSMRPDYVADQCLGKADALVMSLIDSTNNPTPPSQAFYVVFN
jgi:hypothetical protein